MVMVAASTGKVSTNKKTVINTAHRNKDKTACPNTAVTKKLIPPNTELTPAKCNLKITNSTQLCSGCPTTLLNGGYNVQPVALPWPVNLLMANKINLGTNNQYLRLLARGYAMSVHARNKGSNQLPKPPIMAGITMKKIITNA
jgi:hypothetical protein